MRPSAGRPYFQAPPRNPNARQPWIKLFFAYLLGLTLCAALLAPHFILHRYFGAILVGVSALLTGFTFRRRSRMVRPRTAFGRSGDRQDRPRKPSRRSSGDRTLH